MAFFKDKKVLVTGGAGFVGGNLIQRLLTAGARVRATIHRKEPTAPDSRVEYVRVDLTRMEDCHKAVADRDYVFHCAASTSGAAVIAQTPLAHVTPNVVMNAQLLDAAYHARVKRLLWLGSSTGYPANDDHPLKEEEMMQGDPYEKYFCVGWMKRYTEVLCRMYSLKLKDPMTAIVLRPTNIYGPYDDFDFATSHVLPALIRRVVERHDPLEVWGTGNDVRDLVFIDDVVAAMVLAMEKCQGYDAFNIGLGKGYSVKEILGLILDIDGYKNARVIFDPAKPTTIPKRLVDTTKAERVLGFKAAIHLREGIAKTIAWYRTHKA